MMVREEDLVHRRDPPLPKHRQDAAVAAFDEQGLRPVADDAHVDRPAIHGQVLAEFDHAGGAGRTVRFGGGPGRKPKAACFGRPTCGGQSNTAKKLAPAIAFGVHHAVLTRQSVRF
jgi:hypothetical protein